MLTLKLTLQCRCYSKKDKADSKVINIDTKKVDVSVKKDAEHTEVVVTSESNVLKKVVTFFTNLFVKK